MAKSMEDTKNNIDAELAKMNLYDLLGTEIDASSKSIKTAYRKKALTCHPDKNPDNPQAASLFHQLSGAFEILANESTREIYDKILKARLAVEKRNAELDSQRKKLKTDLLERERAASVQAAFKAEFAADLQRQIRKLREEGSELLRKEQESLAKLFKEKPEAEVEVEQYPTLKVMWSKEHNFSTKELETIYNKYGDLRNTMLSRKPGTAILEFDRLLYGAEEVLAESGSAEYPIRSKWIISPQTPTSCHATTSPSNSSSFDSHRSDCFSSDYRATIGAATSFAAAATSIPDYSDREDEILQKLKNAHKRRLGEAVKSS